MIRITALALLLSCLASGQVQWFTFDGTNEKAVTAVTDLGTVVSGDVRDVRFHIRNTGATTATVQTISLNAQGYALNPTPLFPILVAPYTFSEFRVRFTGMTPGSYPAVLSMGSLRTQLIVTVKAGATVSIEDGAIGSVLAPGATLDLGRVKRGNAASRQLRVANGTSADLTIATCGITGTYFRVAGITCPAKLAPGETKIAEILFEPAAAGEFKGTLALDERSIPIAGVGYEPPLPRPAVRFDSLLESGQQRKLTVGLNAASETTGTGTVTLEFRPADSQTPDDPSIRFTSVGGRVLPIKVAEGDTVARIGSALDATFQTGTTAGTLVFKVKLGDYSDDFAFTVAPLPVSIDTATLSRRTGVIDVAVTGFDNTRTTGRFTFTFYDQQGLVVQPGPIRADWSEPFFNYFRTSRVGGAFAAKATFPVNGDATRIGAVEVEMTNTSGVARTSRISMNTVLP